MTTSSSYKFRLLTKEDSKNFHDLIDKNRSRLEDFFAGTVKKTKTLQDTRSYCEEIEQKQANKEYYAYLIVEKKTNMLVGLIDLKNIDWNIPKGELGAFIDKDHEGKGIIRFFTEHLIHEIVAEHKFKKLFCRVAPINVRSIRVVESIGFELEGKIRRDYCTTKGELVDLNFYGRIFD